MSVNEREMDIINDAFDDNISRQGTIKALKDNFLDDDQPTLYQGEFWGAKSVLEVIKQMPSSEQKMRHRGMYECFHCLQDGVVWDGDFDFSDYGEEEEGVIHECHCVHCGAQITYRVPNEREDEE